MTPGLACVATTPKCLAFHAGKVVARTFDVAGPGRKGDFALRFESEPEVTHTIYRDNYATLTGMVERWYPGAKWEDAAMYDI